MMLAFLAAAACEKQNTSGAGDIKLTDGNYVTIEPYMRNFGRLHNAYITSDLNKMQSMIEQAAKIRRDHACGYHWVVRHWEDPYTIKKSYPINVELDCQYIEGALKEVIEGLEEEKYYNIFYLKIYSKFSPGDVIAAIQKEGYAVFLGDDEPNLYSHLPRVIFRITLKGDDEEELESRLKKELDVLYEKNKNIMKAPAQYRNTSWSSFQGKHEIEWEITAYFSRETSRFKAKKIFSKYPGLELIYPKHYHVRIITGDSKNDVLKKLKPHRFVRGAGLL